MSCRRGYCEEGAYIESIPDVLMWLKITLFDYGLKQLSHVIAIIVAHHDCVKNDPDQEKRIFLHRLSITSIH